MSTEAQDFPELPPVETMEEWIKRASKVPQVKELLEFIHTNPITLSLLYDLDLMPEQVQSPHEFMRMLIVAAFIKENIKP